MSIKYSAYLDITSFITLKVAYLRLDQIANIQATLNKNIALRLDQTNIE